AASDPALAGMEAHGGVRPNLSDPCPSDRHNRAAVLSAVVYQPASADLVRGPDGKRCSLPLVCAVEPRLDGGPAELPVPRRAESYVAAARVRLERGIHRVRCAERRGGVEEPRATFFIRRRRRPGK